MCLWYPMNFSLVYCWGVFTVLLSCVHGHLTLIFHNFGGCADKNPAQCERRVNFLCLFPDFLSILFQKIEPYFSHHGLTKPGTLFSNKMAHRRRQQEWKTEEIRPGTGEKVIFIFGGGFQNLSGSGKMWGMWGVLFSIKHVWTCWYSKRFNINLNSNFLPAQSILWTKWRTKLLVNLNHALYAYASRVCQG